MRTGSFRLKAITCGMMLLATILAFAACGGGGGMPGAALLAADTKSTAPLLVHENEIGTLPGWQQRLLSDPGWNQPFIQPRAETPVPPPALDELQTAPDTAGRHDALPAAQPSWLAKSASELAPAKQGEYDGLAPDAVPPYGCNGDAGNKSADGNALEDLIIKNDEIIPAYGQTYVSERGLPVNYFNRIQGVNRGVSSMVSQLLVSQADIDWSKPIDVLLSEMHLADVGYRSSLVPDGAPGSGCEGITTAYAVKDYFWYTFVRNLAATPSMAPLPLYHVYVAPRSPAAGPYNSNDLTTGYKQEFYFGSVNECFGGAWIIGLTATRSSSWRFKSYFDPGNYYPPAWHRPIYGVLLKRWQEMQAPGEQGPWKGNLGWPVYGPTAYLNGAQQLSLRGTYYQWGMWFERGFIWWVDYDNDQGGAYPNVPDEAQAYLWNGKNVFDGGEHGEKLIKLPTTFYGGSGPLGVNVVVDGWRNWVIDPWSPAPLDEAQRGYRVPLPSGDGLATVQIRLSAGGYGGIPGSDPAHPEWGGCLYKHYVWAFRDGTIQAAKAAFDPGQRTAVHTYGDLAINKESVYVVRVQVTDANDNVAYGDSLPITLGHGATGAGCGQILLIRDDAPDFSTYQTNFDALTADLDEIGALYAVVNYDDRLAEDFEDFGYDVAIWYRGGPGAAGEPDYTVPWTPVEEAVFNKLLKHRMLLVSQAHGAVAGSYLHSYWGWDNEPDSQHCLRINSTPMTHATDQNMGLTSDESSGVFGWLNVMMGSQMGKGSYRTPLQRGGLPGLFGSGAAERAGANLANGSGIIPTSFQFGSGTDLKQFCPRGWYPQFGPAWINPGFKPGIQANPSGSGSWDDGCYGAAMLSYGCSSTGGSSWKEPGPGRFWCWSWPYADMTVESPAGCKRSTVLRNVLAWLDPSLYFGLGGRPLEDVDSYEGQPEIVSVTPGYWDAAGYHLGLTSITGINYPDRDTSDWPPSEWPGTDAYRTTLPAGASANNRYILTATPGNDGLNPNDLDFQFPWYGYIKDVNGDGVGTGASGSAGGATDDTIVYRGLLLDDPDANWTRYAPPEGETPLCVLNYADPDPVCAAYFASTSGDAAGDSGDEVIVSYGQSQPSFSWSNTNKLEVECIAHWPQSLSWGTAGPPRVYWSMFPGHGMKVPGTTMLLTDSAEGWDSFRRIFDIDPTYAASWQGVPRSSTSWNRGVFSYTSVLTAGRVVAMDYRRVVNWNGDLNRDGALDAKDKFPVRARIISKYGAYSAVGTWPNHEPLWNPDPAVATFSEGGCYLLDNGPAVYRFQILDDPDYPDPGSSGPPDTVDYLGTYGSYHMWNVLCGYRIKNGIPTYAIQYRIGTDLDGAGPGAVSWSSWINGTARAMQGDYVQAVTCIGVPGISTFNVQIQGIDGSLPPYVSLYRGWAGFRLELP